MRATTLSILSTLFLALLAGGCASGQCPFCRGGDKSAVEACKKLDANFVAAFNKGDADAMAANYWNGPETLMYPPGEMEAHGWQACRDALAEVLKSMPGGQLTLTDPQYRVAGRDVIAYGKWTVTQTNGQQTMGRYTQVMSKKDGKWVIVLDHASMPAK